MLDRHVVELLAVVTLPVLDEFLCEWTLQNLDDFFLHVPLLGLLFSKTQSPSRR